jgi:NDP-sugar pyrophosphorylase family protein
VVQERRLKRREEESGFVLPSETAMAANLANVTAAILAGGLGTRLRAVVGDRPKVLAQVHGRPFLAYLLDQLARTSVAQVVLLTGYLGGQVSAAFGDRYRGLRLVYSAESSPLGTAGALRLALPHFSFPTVLLLNGDSYCDVDLPAFLDSHQRRAAEISLVVSRVADASRFGKVRVGPDGRVLGFEEKRGDGEGWINAGVYLLERRLIEDIPPGRPVGLERDLFPAWVWRAFQAFRGPTRFLDIGTPASYQEAESFFAQRPSA